MVAIFTYPIPSPRTPAVVAIGNFDGVHAGHRHLLELAKHDADERQLPLVVLTFEPHPRSVLFPDRPLHRLTDLPTKAQRLYDAGVNVVAVIPFDTTVAAWSPQHFVDEALVRWLQAQHVVVGANFRYGHKATGDIVALQTDGHFSVRVVELLADDGGVVSSRRLRGEG